MSSEFKIDSHLPADMDGILELEVLNILSEIGEEAVTVARRDWKGWKYAGNYPDVQKGTSFTGWHFQLMKPGELEGTFVRGVSVLNDAKIKARSDSYEPKYWGKPSGKTKRYSNNQVGKKYAAFIARSKGAELEWKLSQQKIKDEVIPDATKRLKDAIISNWTGNMKRVTLLANKSTGGGTPQFNIVTETFK